MTAHNGGGLAVSFAPDGSWLVTSGADGNARIWQPDLNSLLDYACSRLVRDPGVPEGLDMQTTQLLTAIHSTQSICPSL